MTSEALNKANKKKKNIYTYLPFLSFICSRMNEYEIVGKGRTVLPLGRFAFYTLAPMIALYVLATIPTRILGTRIKQVVSFPLMVCLVTIPYLYMDENDGNNIQSLFIVYCLLCC